MPKGEHFKKPNPRINQVSFKVNDTELEKLQELADADKMSIPQWLRKQINHTTEGSIAQTPRMYSGSATKKDNQMSLF